MSKRAALEALEPVYNAPTFGEARNRLGSLIGLDEAAPANMTARTLNDQKFAMMVSSLGKHPKWRAQFLHDPYNAKFAPPAETPFDTDKQSVASVSVLVKKAAQGMLKWGTTGFQMAEPQLMQQRRSACLDCDQLSEPPDTFAYRIAKKVSKGDNRICKACGCIVLKKAAMPTERCPMAALDDPSKSRWGDPIEESTPQSNLG